VLDLDRGRGAADVGVPLWAKPAAAASRLAGVSMASGRFRRRRGAWVRKNVGFALSYDAGARGRRGRLVYGVSLAFESKAANGNQ